MLTLKERDRVAHTISLSEQLYIEKNMRSNEISQDLHSEKVPIHMSYTVEYTTLGDGTVPSIQDKVG